MKMKKLIIATALSVFATAPAFADSGRAGSDISGALSKPVILGSAVAGSVVAIPLLSVGSVGSEVLETSVHVFSGALASGRPLTVTDRTIITKRSPADAMRANAAAEEEFQK
jgi:hypothetical protein